MKRITITCITVLTFLSACTQNKTKETTDSSSTDTLSDQQTEILATVTASATFDINKIPVSTQNVGTFPYLSAPDGYKYADEKTKNFEEKYFFYQDSLVMTIGGKYFHTDIVSANGADFENTYIVNNYKQAVEKLGGVEIYSGGLPQKASQLITKEKPAYIKDLYDPNPYKYKQFVIKTAKENIWIELIHELNANTIDLTIVREEALNASVGIIKADEIRNQLNETGKAVLYINFDTDKSSLKEDGLAAVAEIAKLLENDKALNLSIEGHTDNTGDANHNKSLSTDRANAVLKKLVELKIDTKRLKAIGYGPNKPLVTNDTEENKAKNRRVELVKV